MTSTKSICQILQSSVWWSCCFHPLQRSRISCSCMAPSSWKDFGQFFSQALMASDASCWFLTGWFHPSCCKNQASGHQVYGFTQVLVLPCFYPSLFDKFLTGCFSFFVLKSQAAHNNASAQEGPQSARQVHLFQALIKSATKCQSLKTVRQGHLVQAVVEVIPKCQSLKTVRQGHPF